MFRFGNLLMRSPGSSWCPRPAFLVALFLPLAASSVFAAINDTGQTQCYNAAHVAVACDAAVGGDAGVLPRQDGRFGRDARNAAIGVVKVGAGDAGFDFSKVANNGSVLAAAATLGSAPTQWACTRDNVTGLIWEVKTTAGLRDTAHTYSWYSTDSTRNGGDAGSLGSDTCGGSLSAYSNQCNSANYVAAVNAQALCGANDWRLPSLRELLSIVHAGVATNPAIDTAYFPNTTAQEPYWTRTTHALFTNSARLVLFFTGIGSSNAKTVGQSIMVVRGGQ